MKGGRGTASVLHERGAAGGGRGIVSSTVCMYIHSTVVVSLREIIVKWSGLKRGWVLGVLRRAGCGRESQARNSMGVLG